VSVPTASEFCNRRPTGDERLRPEIYVVTLVTLIALAAVLGSDLPVEITFAPHDDSLYAIRAYYLLHGAAFGPYDSHTLSKLPGISFWLAWSRTLGVPYLTGIALLYAGAGLYMLAALGRAGVGRTLRLILFALYMLNPVTMGVEWHRVLREPLGTDLFVLLLAAMLFVLLAADGRGRARLHVAVLAATFAFALLVREDDVMLWGLLALFAVAMLRAASTARATGLAAARGLVLVGVLIPAASAWIAAHLARDFVEAHYGLPILDDMSEGEFPRLLAAIRSVDSGTDNRLVMAPMETLTQLGSLIPEFAPVVGHLPPVGPNTPSCQLQGVCSEWSNGWMPFWIKDGAAAAGLTPTLVAGQRYFRRVRKAIEAACARGALKCTDRGSGFIPPFELRWTRALVHAFGAVLEMTLAPNPNTMSAPPVLYNVSVSLGRIFQAVTMTDHFDTLAQTSAVDAPAQPGYRNPLAGWRVPLARLYRPLAAALIALGLVAVVLRWTLYPHVAEAPLFWFGALFFAFAALRLAALADVSVFLGPFDPRIMFSTYTGALLVSPAAVADLIRARRASRAPRD